MLMPALVCCLSLVHVNHATGSTVHRQLGPPDLGTAAATSAAAALGTLVGQQ